jgi:hypothetical protein
LEDKLELVLVLVVLLEMAALTVTLALVLVRLLVARLVSLRVVDWSAPRTADRGLPARLGVLCMAHGQLLAALAGCGAFRQPARVVLERLDARRGLTIGLARSQSQTDGLRRRQVVEAALEAKVAVVEAVGPVRTSVVALGIDGRRLRMRRDAPGSNRSAMAATGHATSVSTGPEVIRVGGAADARASWCARRVTKRKHEEAIVSDRRRREVVGGA